MSESKTKKIKWLRVRFESNAEDFRPIYKGKHPEGPWWCSGYTKGGEGCAIIVAYVKSEKTINKQWPEAEGAEFEEVDKPEFSDRFPKPDWWLE